MTVNTWGAHHFCRALNLLHCCARLLWCACWRLELDVLGVLPVQSTHQLGNLLWCALWRGCARAACCSLLCRCCGCCRCCRGWRLASATKKPTGKATNALANGAIDHRIHGIYGNGARCGHRAAHQSTSCSAHALSATTLPCALCITASSAQHIAGKAGCAACIGGALLAKLLAHRVVVGLCALRCRYALFALALCIGNLFVDTRARVCGRGWVELLAYSTIVGAAGGYLLPHPSEKILRVRHRYPVVPWDWWTDVTPDFVLPVDTVGRESLRWIDKPAYNRVFVAGQETGVLGQVTRTGTAGDVLAPMVVDALITQAAAARQRGIAVLADTGRQIEVTLRLPVLPETGIIEPGAFISYQDGGVARLGLVRSTRIDAGLPEVWQTLGVQSYA